MNIGFKVDLHNEFQSDIKKISDSDIIDAVIAFANTDGGNLYIGVEDNGEITGLHQAHRDTIQLAAFIANKTIPPVTVQVEKAQAYRLLKKWLKKVSYRYSEEVNLLIIKLYSSAIPVYTKLLLYEVSLKNDLRKIYSCGGFDLSLLLLRINPLYYSLNVQIEKCQMIYSETVNRTR